MFFKKNNKIINSFHATYDDEKFKAWKRSKIENNIIKDIKNPFRTKKLIDDTTIKDARNLFRLTKEIDDTTVEDIRNLFRQKKRIKLLASFLSRKAIIDQ